MANILLTTKCNRACPYCFAEREMSDSPGERLSWENLIYLANFFQASGEKQLSLLGGEPTLHPNFVDFVLYLVARGFDIAVFTNGILSAARMNEVKEYLTPVSTKQLGFVCNINDPGQTPAPSVATRRIDAFLSVMGPWTSASFNIYRLDFTLHYVCDLINRYGMKREVRLGIAHPIPGKETAHIRPGDIRRAIDRLYEFRGLLERFRIKVGLDCGFPLCGITDEQLGWLYRSTGRAAFGCGPAIDIAPDMCVYSCFPLSRVQRRSIYEFDTLRQVIDFYDGLHRQLRDELPGIYDECDGCVHREDGLCAGGGACQLLCRFVDEGPVRLPEIESGLVEIRRSA